MHSRIPQVLTQEEVTNLRHKIANGMFVDGNAAIPGAAGSVKNNLQLEEHSPVYKEIVPFLMQKVAQSPTLNGVVFPKSMLPPLVSKYEPGMTYGTHVDAPFFRNGDLRADVSITLFLSNPDEYDGGELTIEQGGADVKIKLPAGDAFVYPTTYQHHVAPVTRGTRIAMVSWFQSFIRDERHREVAAQIGQVKARLDREPGMVDALKLSSSRDLLSGSPARPPDNTPFAALLRHDPKRLKRCDVGVVFAPSAECDLQVYLVGTGLDYLPAFPLGAMPATSRRWVGQQFVHHVFRFLPDMPLTGCVPRMREVERSAHAVIVMRVQRFHEQIQRRHSASN